MKTLQMCSRIKKKLDNDNEFYGYVHSVFDSTCNILIDNGQLISLIKGDKPMAPMSIRLNCKKSLKELGIQVNEKVKFTKDSLILTNTGFEISLFKPKIWNGSPCFEYLKDSEEGIKSKLKILEDYIFEQGKLDGIGTIIFHMGGFNKKMESFCTRRIPLNTYGDFIIKRIYEFLNSIINNDLDGIVLKVNRIIGFGPGLTPSVDDFISGIMITLVYFENYLDNKIRNISKLNSQIVSDIKNKTTKVSEEMLNYASIGETTDSIRNLVISIFSKTKENEMENNFLKVINYGDTSGTDIVCGIYIGCRIMLDFINRGALHGNMF